MTDTASASLPALGICLEEYEYPYPVRFLPLANDLRNAEVNLARMIGVAGETGVVPGATRTTSDRTGAP